MKNFLKAEEVELKNICFIDGLASAQEAVEMMKRNNIDALIIKKRDEKDANGIVTASDIVRKVIVKDRCLTEVSVYEIMTKPVVSIPASLNVRYIPRLLSNVGFSVAPIELNGNYIGLLQLRDFIFNEQLVENYK
jgi:signal-transduction protein with cAMP-binding, CBS, and nucleotidyltransferase domain